MRNTTLPQFIHVRLLISSGDDPSWIIFSSDSEGSSSSSSSESESGSESVTSDALPIDLGDLPEGHPPIGDCTHEERFPYPYVDDSDVEAEAIANTTCDLGDPDPQGRNHRAFPDDYQGPGDSGRPSVCSNCYAVICEQCSNGIGEDD